MQPSEAERLTYLYDQSPSRNELRTVLSIVLKMHTAILNLGLAIADGGDPNAVLDALRPVSDDHHRLMKFMREMANAGVDLEEGIDVE